MFFYICYQTLNLFYIRFDNQNESRGGIDVDGEKEKVPKYGYVPYQTFGTSFYSGTVFIPRRPITSLNKNRTSSIVHA